MFRVPVVSGCEAGRGVRVLLWRDESINLEFKLEMLMFDTSMLTRTATGGPNSMRTMGAPVLTRRSGRAWLSRVIFIAVIVTPLLGTAYFVLHQDPPDTRSASGPAQTAKSAGASRYASDAPRRGDSGSAPASFRNPNPASVPDSRDANVEGEGFASAAGADAEGDAPSIDELNEGDANAKESAPDESTPEAEAGAGAGAGTGADAGDEVEPEQPAADALDPDAASPPPKPTAESRPPLAKASPPPSPAPTSPAQAALEPEVEEVRVEESAPAAETEEGASGEAGDVLNVGGDEDGERDARAAAFATTTTTTATEKEATAKAVSAQAVSGEPPVELSEVVSVSGEVSGGDPDGAAAAAADAEEVEAAEAAEAVEEADVKVDIDVDTAGAGAYTRPLFSST